MSLSRQVRESCLQPNTKVGPSNSEDSPKASKLSERSETEIFSETQEHREKDIPVHQGLVSIAASGTTTNPNWHQVSTITVLSDHDVMLGRGTGPNEARGNVKFRFLVRQAIQKVDLDQLDGKLKGRLAKEILDSVKSRGGRFIKAAAAKPENGGRRTFVIVSDAMALDKIKQSFRHQLRVLSESSESKPSGTTSPSPNSGGSRSPGSARSVVDFGSYSGMGASANTAALDRVREILSSCANAPVHNEVFPPYHCAFAPGGTGLPNQGILTRDALMRELVFSQLNAYSPFGAFSSRGFSEAGVDESLASVVNALASLKAEAAVRCASSAALQVPAIAPPSLASALHNIPGSVISSLSQHDYSMRSQQGDASGLVLLEARLALARALSTSSPMEALPAAALGNLSLLEALLSSASTGSPK